MSRVLKLQLCEVEKSSTCSLFYKDTFAGIIFLSGMITRGIPQEPHSHILMTWGGGVYERCWDFFGSRKKKQRDFLGLLKRTK